MSEDYSYHKLLIVFTLVSVSQLFLVFIASGRDIELEGPTLNKDVTRLGVLLLYCDLLITQHMVWLT